MEHDAEVYTELELLERLRSDDASAFDAIVLRFHPELHAYVTRWLGGEAEASDVLQQMFLRLWETRFVIVAERDCL